MPEKTPNIIESGRIFFGKYDKKDCIGIVGVLKDNSFDDTLLAFECFDVKSREYEEKDKESGKFVTLNNKLGKIFVPKSILKIRSDMKGNKIDEKSFELFASDYKLNKEYNYNDVNKISVPVELYNQVIQELKPVNYSDTIDQELKQLNLVESVEVQTSKDNLQDYIYNYLKEKEPESMDELEAEINLDSLNNEILKLAEKYVNFMEKEGLSNTKGVSGMDSDRLRQGMEVEKEHSDDEKIQEKITMDHYAEDENYYNKLKKAKL